MEHNFEQLKSHILPLSVSKSFELARGEWRLIGIEVSEEFDNCPCGKQIKEHCYIRNSLNGNTTYVGNVCVNRFLEIETGNLFAGLKRIMQFNTANANKDLIDYANKAGYLFEGEFKFLMQTRHRKKLSIKQIEWKKKINRRIINKIVVRRRSARAG